MMEPPGLLPYTRIRKSPYFYAHQKHGPRLYSTYNHIDPEKEVPHQAVTASSAARTTSPT